MPNYQVIKFEGLEPIVTNSNPREVLKYKQIHGLHINHKYTTTYFETFDDAKEFAFPVVEEAEIVSETPIEFVTVKSEENEDLHKENVEPIKEKRKYTRSPKGTKKITKQK